MEAIDLFDSHSMLSGYTMKLRYNCAYPYYARPFLCNKEGYYYFKVFCAFLHKPQLLAGKRP